MQRLSVETGIVVPAVTPVEAIVCVAPSRAFAQFCFLLICNSKG